MSKKEGPSLLGSDQQEGYFNRESPPGLFNCEVKGHKHDAEAFIEVWTFEGTEFIPTCISGASGVIKILQDEMKSGHGVRWVNETLVMVASGMINGTLSSR
ncbi:MAG: hypothetical protein UX38_C0004G0098 [Microgenomates group bacterium GW2011_GWC1_46_16]|uniref:Uncharacterized protein n=1 Tax=Candidatus Collierbacteria bacterium RIFOXYA2_FULL_46_10 TaxID=1817726 RepID=A0A1F5F6L3_9BACT|nr:MAG: hypothetical protein UX32_C0019G0002 [Microgenomates group bacterium GW2011_GWF1_46_12]KKU26718.1 MAG: hypothetical protein UX38_C0004G0098 [Microgenomates group bacterium GW2011_GWC1_46_16]KKU27563.1 MAG: hypothetical protein UX40_C0011G0024 [Microgenomates group bacterium GW2011_GWF2_46_18]KKU43602.1 MAG: hypothetical protein UX59_C0013G0008 [Microgenomates group bacterium GW2011_GWA1_46_7]KKU45104.1 MAG: hypothetical protein UX63_C0012G0008 [Microgenomates group bacterium GW2011_GWB1